MSFSMAMLDIAFSPPFPTVHMHVNSNRWLEDGGRWLTYFCRHVKDVKPILEVVLVVGVVVVGDCRKRRKFVAV